MGLNSIPVTVTAEDGVTTLTYLVEITRLPEQLPFTSAEAPALRADGFSTGGVEAPLQLAFHPQVGSALVLVENTSLEPIHGEFSNLTQGQRITLEFEGVAYDFIVNYYGGSGNDLVLHWADTFAAAWGLNSHGQLGKGDTRDAASPVYVHLTANVLAGKTLMDASAGYLHSLALCHDGTMASWGYNTQGQLGLGHRDHVHLPTLIPTGGDLQGKRIIAIAAGAYHNLALASDGSLFAWGMNQHGQLGTGDRETRPSPTLVEAVGALAGKRIMAIAAGSYHSLALCSDGSVVAWGYNDEGQLGDGSTQTPILPVAVDLGGKQITHMAAGQYHSLALATDGTLRAWGWNGRGQLGDGSTTDQHRPVTISLPGGLAGKPIAALLGGGMHSLLRFADGTLAGWGDNSRGQLIPAGAPRYPTPQALPGSALSLSAGSHHSLALHSASSLRSWGDPRVAIEDADPAALQASSRWIAAASGPAAFHNIAIVALPSQVGVPGESAAGETAGTGFAGWLQNHFPQGAPADAKAHLPHYAFGLDPHTPDLSRLPRPKWENQHLTLRFATPQHAEGLRIAAEWSPDLRPDSWQELPNLGPAGEHHYQAPPSPTGRAFLRLKIEPGR